MESANFVSFGSISSPQPSLKFHKGFGRLRHGTDEISSNRSLSDITDTKARSKGLFEDDLSSESAESGEKAREVTRLENALLEMTQDLRNEFYRGLSMYTDQNDIVQLVRHFETVCEEHYFRLEKHSQSAGGASSVLRLLKAEKLAWRWLWTLIECRQESLDNSKPTESLDGWMTDSDIFHYMLKFDNKFRELRALVRCLECEAVEWTNDNIAFNFEDKIDFLWTNTRDCLRKNEKNYSTFLVNELDPDAPFRQERSIKDVDAAKQETVFKTVFNLIRIGHIDEAIVLSQRQGSQWLAAILAGGRLSRSIDGSNSIIENAISNEGDMDRRLYNKICMSVAKEATLSPNERAIYGALSGFLPATLLGCSTWEDHLWAFASASCEKLFIDFLTLLRMKAPAETAKFLDEASFAEQKDMFQRFILHSAEKFSSEDDTAPYRLIPLFFNLEAYNKLLDMLNSWKRYVQPHEQILLWSNLHRFVCHVTIVFHQLYRAPNMSPVHANENERENLHKIGSPFSCDYFSLPDCIGTIQGYLDLLAAEKEILLYPHYAVFLPRGSHVNFVADFLYDIASDEDRKMCLSVIENCELNVVEICRAVVQNVIDNLLPSPFSIIADAVTGKESAPLPTSQQVVEVVRSLLFLQSIPDLRFDAISQACLMARRFLLLQMFSAASEVFSRVHVDFVKNAVKYMPSSDEDEDAWKVCQNRLREYNCLREYSNAYSAFRDWSDMFSNKKPERAECSTVYDAGMPTSMWQQTERERSQAMERWNADTLTYFEIAELTMRQILIGTDGEWLVDAHEEDDTIRRQEMVALRKRCIPMVADMLVFMYQSMKQYDKVLALSEVIADESGKLYQLFEKSQLKSWFDRLTECSFQCLHEGLDSFGLPYRRL
ncbi:Nup84 Nup100 domain containing protein [Trichuris trichiura]|uniref:Nuclear pore complex protein n=1 Tax=Trichuris trichiura TaxID=36087 RepID=A0A077YW33_TRITR|nr:Nup84 Nup100 domain containing protein [Trichuris trichiura]